MAAVFSGFPEEGMKFLRGLAKHNNRDWFQPRKEIFERSLKRPMEQLVEALNAQMLKYAPMYITEPRRAIYRIYRDTRFSKDKTPYKDHIAASFTRMGLEKHISAGFYFSVSPVEIEVAAGVYMPGPEQLKAIREYLIENHEEFREILDNRAVRNLMGPLWGEQMARTPKGFPTGHPADDLIRYKQWIFYDTRMDPTLAVGPKLLPELTKRFRALTPFVEYLNRPLGIRKRSPADIPENSIADPGALAVTHFRQFPGSRLSHRGH
jgi:uncharacterized protein (TIGR02453 family)